VPVIGAPEPGADQSQAAVEPKASETPSEAQAPAAKSAQRVAPKTREAEVERRRADRSAPRPPRNVQRSNDPFGRGGLFGIFR